jgi:hypothetical protein
VKAITTYKVNQHQISVELRKTDQTLRLKSNGNEQNKKRNDKREKNTFETRVANPLEIRGTSRLANGLLHGDLDTLKTTCQRNQVGRVVKKMFISARHHFS